MGGAWVGGGRTEKSLKTHWPANALKWRVDSAARHAREVAGCATK